MAHHRHQNKQSMCDLEKRGSMEEPKKNATTMLIVLHLEVSHGEITPLPHILVVLQRTVPELKTQKGSVTLCCLRKETETIFLYCIYSSSL